MYMIRLISKPVRSNKKVVSVWLFKRNTTTPPTITHKMNNNNNNNKKTTTISEMTTTTELKMSSLMSTACIICNAQG
jgi:penicillin V acylase-like amidase (Ntn superfamily)